MFHEAQIIPGLAPSEPSVEALHREDFIRNRTDANASTDKPKGSVPAVDVRLMRAQFLANVGRFIRFA